MLFSKERAEALSILEKNALSFEDVTKVRGYIFESGIASREEAEMLMAVDRGAAVDVAGWSSFYVDAVSDFVVWQSRPTGRITESDLDWLMGCLGDRPTANGKALLFNLVRESHEAPARLSEIVMRIAAA